MTTGLDHLLTVAHLAVDLGEQQLRGRPPTVVHDKGDRDMVTDTDLAIERDIRALLARHTPAIPMLGEEEGGTTGPTHWVLDPVDGTANHARALPLTGVSLALVRDQVPVLGVISLPLLGTRHWALAGHGAFRDGRRVSAATTVDLGRALIAVGDYGTGPDADPRNAIAHALHQRLASRAQRIRMLGSATVDLAWVADARLDASLTLGNRSWDMAAGAVIAREAGARVVDHDGSQHTSASRVHHRCRTGSGGCRSGRRPPRADQQRGAIVLITFEGLPGAGKTTQVRLLADCLRRRGRTVVVLADLRTLDTDPLAADLLQVLAAEGDPFLRGSDPVVDTLLTAAIRADLVATVLSAALETAGPDGVVLEDRGVHTMSSYALAGLARTRTPPEAALLWVDALTRLAGPLASRALWLRTPVDVAVRRARGRNPHRPLTAEHQAYLHRVDHGYHLLAAQDPQLLPLSIGDRDPAQVHRLVHHSLWSVPDSVDTDLGCQVGELSES